MDYKKYQEETFNEIVAMKYRMQMLAGFVQNDFERLLQDGMVTKEEIAVSVLDVEREFEKTKEMLDFLQEKVISIIRHYI